MGINSRNLEARRKSLYIPVTGMNGYSVDLLVGGGDADSTALGFDPATGILTKVAADDANFLGGIAATDKNARLRALANGTPRLSPVSTLAMTGLLLTTAADGIEFCGMIPFDCDVTKPIGVRAWWTSEAAAVGDRTITFAATYKTFAADAALAAADTALNTVIAAQAPKGTSKALQQGNRGIINANTITTAKRFWSWKVLMSAFDAAFVERKYLLGVEIDYLPYYLAGPRQVRDNAPAYTADTRAY